MGDGVGERGDHLRVVAAGFLADVEGVVGVVFEVQPRARAEFGDYGAKQREFGESVVGALREKHRLRDLAQVRGALAAGLAGGVQREAEEHDAARGREFCARGDLRSHAATERFAACEQRQLARAARGLRERRAHSAVQHRRRVETPLAHWVHTAARRLKPGGWLTMIAGADSLPDLLAALTPGLGSAAVLPLAPRDNRPALRIILRARKTGRAAFRLLAPFILHQGPAHAGDRESYTPKAQAVLREAADLSAEFR